MRVILFLLLLPGVYFVLIHGFAIREITVVGSGIDVQIDKNRMPKTLLFFPSDRIAKKLLADNPRLADVRFEKKYPHTLVITVTSRPAVAILVTPSRRVLIDATGTILTDAGPEGSGLPTIVTSAPDVPLSGVLAFLAGVSTFFPVETITIMDNGAVKAHAGDLDIVFTQDGDIPAILTTLQTSLAGFRIKGTLPKGIDLRFDKPVVTF